MDVGILTLHAKGVACGRGTVVCRAYLSLAKPKIAFCQGDKHQVHMQDTRQGKARHRQMAMQVKMEGKERSREGAVGAAVNWELSLAVWALLACLAVCLPRSVSVSASF